MIRSEGPAAGSTQKPFSYEEHCKDIEQIHASIGWSYPVISALGFVQPDAAGERIVGYVSFCHDRRQISICFLAVHKDYQGNRLGKELFGRVVRYAREHDADSIRLDCKVDKVGEFYRKCAKTFNLALLELPGGSYDDGDEKKYFLFNVRPSSTSQQNRKAVPHEWRSTAPLTSFETEKSPSFEFCNTL